jgi:hypothetical protein
MLLARSRRRKAFLKWLNQGDTGEPCKIKINDQSLEAIEPDFPDDDRPVHLEIRLSTSEIPMHLNDRKIRQMTIITQHHHIRLPAVYS